MNLTIEEAINRLKAEIIAQDWRISPRRAEMIEAAFACLKEHFHERKKTQAMLSMAMSVLEHIKTKGSKPPETIDFLKEAMAHVVGQYEDLHYDQKKEDKIFKSLFRHFTLLKEKILEEAKMGRKKPGASACQPAAAPVAAPGRGQADTDQEASFDIAPVGNIDAEKLVRDLRNSLEKAGEVGSTIGDLLNHLIADQMMKRSAGAIGTVDPQEPAITPLPAGDAGLSHVGAKKPMVDPIKECPPTAIRLLTIDSEKVAVLDGLVAAVKPVKAARLPKYKSSLTVPLKDLVRPFQGLPEQFKGPLHMMKHGKLKRVLLPVMIPLGLDLPDEPDEQATSLVVLSNGNWHGIILCREAAMQTMNMVKFKKSHNGDIAGIAYLDDDSEITLLDSVAVLRREGFFILPSN